VKYIGSIGTLSTPKVTFQFVAIFTAYLANLCMFQFQFSYSLIKSLLQSQVRADSTVFILVLGVVAWRQIQKLTKCVIVWHASHFFCSLRLYFCMNCIKITKINPLMWQMCVPFYDALTPPTSKVIPLPVTVILVYQQLVFLVVTVCWCGSFA